jgi:hypothetical protein
MAYDPDRDVCIQIAEIVQQWAHEILVYGEPVRSAHEKILKTMRILVAKANESHSIADWDSFRNFIQGRESQERRLKSNLHAVELRLQIAEDRLKLSDEEARLLRSVVRREGPPDLGPTLEETVQEIEKLEKELP